jgi:predicted nucleotidyltransferase component of viral defense system
MIQLSQIKNYFPAQIRDNAVFDKHILKEYLQLLILDYLSSTPYIRKITFIGGTNLRLVKGIDRFSEDLDFDCKHLSKEEFGTMTDDVLRFLENSGFREERFLIKIERQDQSVDYKPIMANVKGCGFFFPLPVPPDGVLAAMKIAAMLSRAKGRDFYDIMFLLAQTPPDYDFLSKRCGINNLAELKQATVKLLNSVDLKQKQKDFEHLLFVKEHSNKILRFGEFINEM